MPLKDLLVHLDHSPHCKARLALAIALAHRFDAHLIGLYVKPPTNISPFHSDLLPRETQDELDSQAAQQRDVVEAMFQQAIGRELPSAEWLEGLAEDAAPIIIAQARQADLIILGQVDPDATRRYNDRQLLERIVMSAGRPVLMVPYAGAFKTAGERVLIAWNGSAQAARAVADALPFLTQAQHVVVLTIGQEDDAPGGDQARVAGLLRHLVRHGVKAAASHALARDAQVGEVILSRAGEEGADLIVMGVYGHSRMRELVMGSVSERILAEMTMPVLMAH